MTEEKKVIHLSRILSFCIFTKTPIDLFIHKDKPIKFYVEELEDESFLAFLFRPSDKEVFDFESIQDQQLKFKIPYHDQIVEFESSLLSVKDKGVFSFHLPFQATALNLRDKHRVSFPEENSFEAVLFFSDERVCRSSQLVDYNSDSISIVLEAGVNIQAGESVEKLEINYLGRTVFESSCEVKKIYAFEGKEKVILSITRQELTDSKELEKRNSPRTYFEENNFTFLQFTHPFDQREIHAKIKDISPSGISFSIEKKSPILIGSKIYEASLLLTEKFQIPVLLEVLNERDTSTSTSLLVGASILNLDKNVFGEIQKAVQRHIYPNVFDIGIKEYEDFIAFLFETNFIYNQKRKQIQNNANLILSTYYRLFSQKNNISRQLVYKSEDVIKGHGSFVQIFDSTWIAQHINTSAEKAEMVVKDLYNSLVLYFNDPKANSTLGYRYIISYYRPNSIFPDTIYNSIHQIIGDEGFYIQPYDFCLLKKDFDSPITLPNELSIEEVTEESFEVLKPKLNSVLSEREIEIEDLGKNSLLELGITQEYKKLALYRNRRVFELKDSSSNTLGAAVCNFCSPGINLSELTNSLKIFVFEEAKKANLGQTVADCLGKYVKKVYAETKMPNCVLLAKKGDFIPSNFENVKIYNCWSLDLNFVKQFQDAFEYSYKNIKKLIKERSSRVK